MHNTLLSGGLVLAREGLAVRETYPASAAVRVEPGWLLTGDGHRIERLEEITLPIRPGGIRDFKNQQYTLKGVIGQGPAGWNGDDFRGNGGAPYQRMVPGTLVVWDQDRCVRYKEGEDYISDSYWGTIKARTDGGLKEGIVLSLDYSVYLCRYDAIVLHNDGSFQVIEGSSSPKEQRELMLPDPPMVTEGIVLAHIFNGWDRTTITSGNAILESGKAEVTGVYQDMSPRTYEVQIKSFDMERLTLDISCTGEDYGVVDKVEKLRITDPIVSPRSEEVPLLMNTAYGRTVDWGLGLRIGEDVKEGDRFIVRAEPKMIFNLANPNMKDPVSEVTIQNFQRLHRTIGKLGKGESTTVALFGESTTRWGKWPYLLRDGLERLTLSEIRTVNAGVGGENSIGGLNRLNEDVWSRRPDLVIVEFMINDSCMGMPEASEEAMRSIARRIIEYGADCLIMTLNGMNPLFSPFGSTRNFKMHHTLFERIAEEEGCAFAGGYALFEAMDRYGRYFMTELKGNMINHPYGNVDPGWGDFEKVVADAIVQGFSGILKS